MPTETNRLTYGNATATTYSAMLALLVPWVASATVEPR